MQDALTGLTKAIRETNPGQILIITGAGVSHASGIPTFRGNDPGAIWKRDVTELGTNEFFEEDPAGSWSWYLARYENLRGKKPNPGHLAIAALERFQLERGGDFLLVTQNIDTLHEQAGSKRMIKVHGSSDRYRCSKIGCSLGAPSGSILASEVDITAFRAEPVQTNVPHCPACGSFLRMHVLWFDEMYLGHYDYQWKRIGNALEQNTQLIIFAGTSFSVGVTQLALYFAENRKLPVYNIDPTPRIENPNIINLAAGSETALVKVCEDLGIAL